MGESAHAGQLTANLTHRFFGQHRSDALIAGARETNGSSVGWKGVHFLCCSPFAFYVLRINAFLLQYQQECRAILCPLFLWFSLSFKHLLCCKEKTSFNNFCEESFCRMNGFCNKTFSTCLTCFGNCEVDNASFRFLGVVCLILKNAGIFARRASNGLAPVSLFCGCCNE